MEPFGKYLLGDRIAYGGMAEIFAAKVLGAEGFEKELVIKRILPAWSQDPEFVEMFVNEATVAAKLRHANIVQVFDFNQVDGVFYLAMELVEGKDLQRVLRECIRTHGKFSVRLAVYVAVETLKALHYAHQDGHGKVGVIHRDISPQNVLISYDGEVKVTDFGIAKAFSAASLTRPGIVKGKLAYMAPEQLLRTGVDPRTDLYALGIVLWEMLVGKQLFRGESDAETLAAVLQGEIPSPRKLNSEVSEALAQICLRLLSRDPADRFASAALALRALSELGIVDANAQLDMGEMMRSLFPLRSRATASAGAVGGTAESTVALDAEADLESVRTLRPPPSSLASISNAVAGTGLRRGVSMGAAGLVVLGGLVLAYQIIPGSRENQTRLAVLDGGVRMDAPQSDAALEFPPDGPGPADARPVPPDGARPPVFRDAAGIPLPSVVPATATETIVPNEKITSPTAMHAAAPQEKAVVPARALLTVLVHPWAQVYVDGKSIGQTPVRKHRVAAGKHVVVIKNEVLSEQQTEAIDVQPGQHVVLQRRFAPQP